MKSLFVNNILMYSILVKFRTYTQCNRTEEKKKKNDKVYYVYRQTNIIQ